MHHGVAVQVLALQDAFKLGTHLLLFHRHRHAEDRLDEIRAVLDCCGGLKRDSVDSFDREDTG